MERSFNVYSKKWAYCKQHAEDGMVNVYNGRCSHGSCKRKPSFNVKGNKTARHCKQHAVNGMVNVRTKRCSHNSCFKLPAWGVLTDSAATACRRHKSDILGGPVINFRVRCKVANCGRVSRWGLNGKQPTHCFVHGPLEEGLVCNVGTARSKSSCRRPSYGAVRGPSFHVKTECLF